MKNPPGQLGLPSQFKLFGLNLMGHLSKKRRKKIEKEKHILFFSHIACFTTPTMDRDSKLILVENKARQLITIRIHKLVKSSTC